MHRVSVIVPCFNREKLIGETLSNLLNQTLQPHEIIVVDDGSTDRSVEVIRSFGNSVKLVEQVNHGPGAARNAGLRIATGEFIQFQDSDDLLSLNKVEAQARIMEATGADLVYGPFVKGYINNGILTLEDVVLQQEPLPKTLPLHEWVLRGLSIVFQACLVRRVFLEKLGGYRVDLMPSEDSELLFRMGINDVQMAFSPDVLTVYRLHHTDQITSGGISRANRLKDWAKMLLTIHSQLSEKKIRLHWQTLWIAETELWNTRQWMDRLECVDADLARALELRYSANPTLFYACCRLYQRLSARWRWHRYHARWPRFYRFGLLTQYQKELLKQIGLGCS